MKSPAVDLSSHSSWLLGKRKDLFPEAVNEIPLDLAEKTHSVALITDSGDIFQNCQPLLFYKGKIQINKPKNWDDKAYSFHLLLRFEENIWFFYLPEKIITYPSYLLVSPPDRLEHLQYRQHKRVVAPKRTRALLRSLAQGIDYGHVKDISESGMLVSVASKAIKYPVRSIIHDLFVVGMTGEKNLTDITHRIMPLVNKGEIVRAFYNQKQATSSYGVSFLFKNEYEKTNIRNLISNI